MGHEILYDIFKVDFLLLKLIHTQIEVVYQSYGYLVHPYLHAYIVIYVRTYIGTCTYLHGYFEGSEWQGCN